MPSSYHIQRLIDRGRGMAAKALGGPYAVYRLPTQGSLSSPATGVDGAPNFIDPANLVTSDHLVYYTQKPASAFRGSFEGTNLNIPLFDLISDMTDFQVGDVFVMREAPYPRGFGAGATSVPFQAYEFSGFCLAFHGDIKKSIGARLDRLAQIYQQGTLPDSNAYLSGDTDASIPIILNGAVFQQGALGATPALIPVGFSSTARWRGELIKKLPTTTAEVVYFAYVPPLPGFTFREGDRLVLQDGSKYLVMNPYEQFVGFSGSQLVIAREGVQN